MSAASIYNVGRSHKEIHTAGSLRHTLSEAKLGYSSELAVNSSLQMPQALHSEAEMKYVLVLTADLTIADLKPRGAVRERACSYCLSIIYYQSFSAIEF